MDRGVQALVLAGAVLVAVVVGYDHFAPAPTPVAQGPVHHGPPAPERGSCRAVMATLVFDARHVRDDSPVVPCREGHTTETVFVWTVEDATTAVARDLADECGLQASGYLDAAAGWIPYGSAVYLPSEAQAAHGASWVRCDVGFIGDSEAREPAAWTTYPARGLAADSPVERRACAQTDLDRLDVDFTDCARPHLTEATGKVVRIGRAATYPTTSERQARAWMCEDRIDPRLDRQDLRVHTAWTPRRDWRPGDDVLGYCWVDRTDGAALPPMR